MDDLSLPAEAAITGELLWLSGTDRGSRDPNF